MKKSWIILLSVVGVLLTIGISYALWMAVFEQKNENLVTTDCFKMTFEEDSNSNITLNQSYPLSESEGVRLKPYTFKITNVCRSIGNYQINMELMESNTMPSQVIRTKLNEEESVLLTKEVEPTVGTKAYKIGSGRLLPNETKEYALRLWMDESTTMEDGASNKSFVGKVSIVVSYEKYYQEEILHGTDPVLKEGLIPVTIDNNGVVHKADTSEEWYKYADKKWANAVILEDESIQYQDNEEIPEDNIESYFVWIPRYKYKIFNEGNYEGLTSVEKREKTIEVEFESKSVIPSTGSKEGEWLTHPAFISFDVNGIWVGKFETGYKDAATTTDAEQNIVDTEKVEIKPNVYSWRSIQAGNAHLNSYNYKREMDSHMMKNTEWGAVAYLSHSAYGSQASVRINNNDSYITGYSAKNEPTAGSDVSRGEGNMSEETALGIDGTSTYNYRNSKSVVSSTTGNYSGIYDMSGGAWEYVMAMMMDQEGNPVSGRYDTANSNFIGTLTFPSLGSDTSKTNWTALDGGVPFPEDKYYDTYAYSLNALNLSYRILGDATGEMGPFGTFDASGKQRRISSWYSDEAWGIDYNVPWFVRSAPSYHGKEAGIFSFMFATGATSLNTGYRIVLAI